MRYRKPQRTKGSKRTSPMKVLTTLILLVLTVAAAYMGYLLLKDSQPPIVALTPLTGYVSNTSEFSLSVQDDTSTLKSIQIDLLQGNKTVKLSFVRPEKTKTYSATFAIPAKTIKDGPFTLVLSAIDSSLYNLGKGNANIQEYNFTLDTKKPRVSIDPLQLNVNRGGAGILLYNIDENVRSSGVTVGKDFFPGYQMPSGKYACLFTFPYYTQKSDFNPKLSATDLAGNVRTRSIAFHANNRDFRHDVINIPDRFLERKMAQYEDLYPDAKTPLDIFIQVNNELRKNNRNRLKTIGKDTANHPLWIGSFIRMKNAKTMATFGDERTYKYKGKSIDNQTHLGVDLASTRNAIIQAANSGRVVHTGFYGIYGESVIIDHGLGLQTLYSHMSQIQVQPGETVKKGQAIGRTGATGMAGGDHLHFGVIISGVPVNPVEWWDPHWIKNNLTSKLQ